MRKDQKNGAYGFGKITGACRGTTKTSAAPLSRRGQGRNPGGWLPETRHFAAFSQ